jgi:hypothetical protein
MSMLYKAPGPHFCDGSMVDYIVVPDHLDDETVASGWFRTIHEALAAVAPVVASEPVSDASEVVSDDAPPTRAEMEQKATELGIKFDGRTTDAKLLARIEEALKG